MQTSSISAKMLLMKCWNTAEALVRPKGITNHLKEPQWDRKEVFISTESLCEWDNHRIGTLNHSGVHCE